MAKVLLRNGKTIEDFCKPYIIAEINSSHNGSVEIAMTMIDEAINCGCDCVKFQSWSSSSLYSNTYYKENPIAKRFVDKLSLNESQLKELAQYAHAKGIDFSSTPYSNDEVDFLIDECDAPFVKISSMEINNYDFLKYIGNRRVPVILSTGMSTYEEVEKAIEVLNDSGCESISLLHCVSLYPTQIKTVNLNNIIELRNIFVNCPIGFSDHTLDDTAAIAATALGACIIEKHFTLDKKRVGMDNSMAIEPADFKRLVEKCIDVQMAMGGRQRVITDEEYEQRKKMRRSVVTKRKFKKGEKLNRDDLCVKRPGTGIPPENIDMIVNKVVARDIDADEIINYADIIDV